jgi:hypothetical protein
LRDKIDDMMKSNENLVNKTLEANMIVMEKKCQEKQARCESLQEDERSARPPWRRVEQVPRGSGPWRSSLLKRTRQ